MHGLLDLDDLAVFRAQTSAQTAAEHINLRSAHLLCRPPQARTAAVTHLPSAHPTLQKPQKVVSNGAPSSKSAPRSAQARGLQ